MAQIGSYSKVWALGHKETASILDGEVVVQEKVDGSQFSFGNLGGDLHCRSKGQQVGPGGNQEGMFGAAVKVADLVHRTGTLLDGMIIRAEYLQKPKHNALCYNRVPTGNLAIFDIEMIGGANFLSPEEVQAIASKWGMETVPTLFKGEIRKPELERQIKDWLERESFLGGPKIEGVVIKNYGKYDTMGKVLMGKFVSEAFKEVHGTEWKKMNPGQGDVISQIIASFNKEAIWLKAIQHKRDEGVLLNEPKDIGMLIGEIKKDFEEEHGERIKSRIFKEFWEDVVRGVLKGFPIWYKEQLLKSLTQEPPIT